jgi:predicted AAA+ superfamily ATPase
MREKMFAPPPSRIIFMIAVNYIKKRIGKLECDFILRRGDSEYSYVQACMTMATSRETEDHEYAPLSKIRDNYPKYILTRNDPIQKRDGIIHKNLPQFMAGGTLF